MSKKKTPLFSHETLEKNIGLMIIASIVVVIFAGLVQIVPLFFQHSTTTPAPGIKPYDSLSLIGRDLYIREGCVGCHSQQIRMLRAEVQRYGPYSVAGESVYDHPFLWGSKRTGPDLTRVGARYSDEWHRIHLRNPRDVVPESNMPGYPWLAERTVEGSDVQDRMKALRFVGVPYTDADALVAYLQGLGVAMRNAQLEEDAKARETAAGGK
jgi:cytochrome c oxidase cbb3-type subunit II